MHFYLSHSIGAAHCQESLSCCGMHSYISRDLAGSEVVHRMDTVQTLPLAAFPRAHLAHAGA